MKRSVIEINPGTQPFFFNLHQINKSTQMKTAKLILIFFLLIGSTYSFCQNRLSFYSSNTLGYLALDNSSFSFQTINGVSLNKRIHFGVGIGLEKLDNHKYLPLFFETKIHLRDQEKSTIPFLSAMIGNEFSILPHTQYGGVTYGINGGVSHFFSSNIGITCSVGYRYVYLNNSLGLGEIILPVLYNKNLLELRFGLVLR